MKESQLYMSFSNIWIALSFLIKGYDRVWMIVIGSIWLLISFVISKNEKKIAEENKDPQKKIEEFGAHNKRYYIKDGELVDRDEVRVEGFKEVKSK